MATKKSEKKTNGKAKKELSAKERKALEKKRDQLYSVRSADEDLPYEFTEAMENLTDKSNLKDIKAALKTAKIDGSGLFAAVDAVKSEWKSVSEQLTKASKAAGKEIVQLDKQLGGDESPPSPMSHTFTF